MNRWTTDNIRDIEGKKIIVTGGARGIGFASSEALASKGAELVLAVRNMARGEEAMTRIIEKHPGSRVTVMHLDLGDLASVKQFAEEFASSNERLDILINNAGVLVPPYSKTKDGFELQFGTNHLGHFALTSHLLPLLMATPLSRVVTISSIAARNGKINFGNLDGSLGYNPMKFYRQSKLANLLFAVELQHRLERAGSSTISVLCHPGISVTNVLSRGSGKEMGRVIKRLMSIVAQPAAKGALPTLYAATHSLIRGGEFIGPDGRGNTRGYPVLTNDVEKFFDAALAAKLWEVSEELTGIRYSV